MVVQVGIVDPPLACLKFEPERTFLRSSEAQLIDASFTGCQSVVAELTGLWGPLPPGTDPLADLAENLALGVLDRGVDQDESFRISGG